MGASILLAKKDAAILFRSPLAFVVLTCFLVIAGYFFATTVGYYQLLSIQIAQWAQGSEALSPQDMIIGPYLQNSGLILLFFLPLLTMRGFSEEKRMGTFELLMSYPLREAQLVGGKLLALALFLVVALVFSMVGPALLFLYIPGDVPALMAGYAGLMLMALSFSSLGLFLSTLTENQIASASMTFAALLILWLISWLKEMAPQQMSGLVEGVSLISHFTPFAQGVLVFSDVIYYLVFTAAFFWLSVLSLENQRWRG